MSVTPSQLAETLRRRAARRDAKAQERARVLLARLPEARRILLAHGARRVWLFGSLATGHPHTDSDVDLGIEGLPSSVYFAALADVTAALGCTVDLVRMEDAPSSLRERIAAEGRPA